MTELEVYRMLFGITFACNIGLTIYLWQVSRELKNTKVLLGVMSIFGRS